MTRPATGVPRSCCRRQRPWQPRVSRTSRRRAAGDRSHRAGAAAPHDQRPGRRSSALIVTGRCARGRRVRRLAARRRRPHRRRAGAVRTRALDGVVAGLTRCRRRRARHHPPPLGGRPPPPRGARRQLGRRDCRRLLRRHRPQLELRRGRAVRVYRNGDRRPPDLAPAAARRRRRDARSHRTIDPGGARQQPRDHPAAQGRVAGGGLADAVPHHGRGWHRHRAVGHHPRHHRTRRAGSARLLAGALESTNEMVSVTDVHDRLTFVNAAFLRAYGYTRQN